MTPEQRQILKRQVARVEEAKHAHERETETLRGMLAMHDARFADPSSGVAFDIATLTIEEPSHATE